MHLLTWMESRYMPNRLTRTEYDRLGQMKNLTLQGNPALLQTNSCIWVCNLCGKVHTKSYRALRVSKYGCPCQNPVTTKINKYVLLATRLGIKWVGQKQPANTKTKTLWLSRNGRNRVEATYAQLAYMPISAELKTQLGI